MVVENDQILDTVNDLIQDLGSSPIVGGLSITGHEYWVILEYGSSPAEPNPQPSEDDVVLLQLPDDIPAPKGHADWYPIQARYKKKLRFIDSYGKLRMQFAVHHPGIFGRGFLRRTIETVELQFQEVLDGLQRELGDELPSRRDLVAIFNAYLRSLLTAVRAATPIETAIQRKLRQAPDDGEGHLRDSFSIDLAR
jgi:hypothetical protein